MPGAGLRIQPLHRVDPQGCWSMMVEEFGSGLDERRRFMLNGIDAAVIAEADTPGLRTTFTAEFDRLRAALDTDA